LGDADRRSPAGAAQEFRSQPTNDLCGIRDVERGEVAPLEHRGIPIALGVSSRAGRREWRARDWNRRASRGERDDGYDPPTTLHGTASHRGLRSREHASSRAPAAPGASRYGATDLSILIDTVTRRIVRRRTISLLHDHSLRRRIRDMGRTFRATVRLR